MQAFTVLFSERAAYDTERAARVPEPPAKPAKPAEPAEPADAGSPPGPGKKPSRGSAGREEEEEERAHQRVAHDPEPTNQKESSTQKNEDACYRSKLRSPEGKKEQALLPVVNCFRDLNHSESHHHFRLNFRGESLAKPIEEF